MNGVAAEVAEEIGVLLEHDHVDAGPREQEAEHHARRPAAGDAALGGRVGCQPRPTNGILVAMTVMNRTLASSGRLAM